jgi:N-hydroxyarylamine O-acetyltransferase
MDISTQCFVKTMDVEKYLKRIHCSPGDGSDLIRLHENHVRFVPFENVDIHYGKMFDLQVEHLYKKIVEHNRGGFCYELNLLFNELLTSLGYQSRIIEARIFTEEGNSGPPFDHMSVLVEMDKKYLADVGFGDLFLKPLEIREGIQSDGLNNFKIERQDDFRYVLSMEKEDRSFEKKYVFDLRPVNAEDFYGICIDKQTSSESYFVKNLVCTKPTTTGRVTIFNNNMIERRGSERVITKIEDDGQRRKILEEKFDIRIN